LSGFQTERVNKRKKEGHGENQLVEEKQKRVQTGGYTTVPMVYLVDPRKRKKQNAGGFALRDTGGL